jgi:hypothetical protein
MCNFFSFQKLDFFKNIKCILSTAGKITAIGWALGEIKIKQLLNMFTQIVFKGFLVQNYTLLKYPMYLRVYTYLIDCQYVINID